MGRWVMFLAAILFILTTAFGWVVGPGMEQEFVPGVWVWDVSLGGKTPAEAAPYLYAALPLNQPNVILVGPEGQRWSFSPADLGMTVAMDETLSRAYVVGHSRGGLGALSERLDVMLNGDHLSPVLSWDPRPAAARLQAVAQELERPVKDAGLRMAGAQLALEPGSIGRRMEVSATLEALLPYLYALEPAEIVPVITEVRPEISDDRVEQAMGMARAILSEPLTLLLSTPDAGDPGPWVITPDVLAGMLDVQVEADRVWVGVDEPALAQFLGPVAMALYRAPVDATFRFDASAIALEPISPSVMGRELSVTASISLVNDRLQIGEHFIPLVIHTLPPARPDTMTAADLGIRELVAVGESYFTGSSSARDRNIRLGASKFDGIIIAPQQTFSFNEYLGAVTAEAGYDESYVIINGRTVPGVGGGICQVATTAFRAAFYGGYPIVERWPHAYRVGYYELGGFGPGFDATVYSPLVDFRFTNDTPYHILVQTEVDPANARLRFLFYSTKEGRTVEQLGPEWGEPEPPEAPIYEFDATLPAGTSVKVETPHDGLLATLGRIVRSADGVVLYHDTFISHFVPWPERYRYGPDFIPPPNAEIIKPEE